jgi:hypothetical protein
VDHPTLRVAFALQSVGQATPLVNSFSVSYTSQPAPVTMTLVAAPVQVVFGQSVNLSGVLSQGGLSLSGQPVTVSAEPFGATTFAPLATPTTDSNGAYSLPVMPTTQTVYQASATGVSVPPTVTVNVAQLVKLAVRRSGAKVYLNGSLGPKKADQTVVIQVRAGKGWKTLVRVRTTSRSTFKVVRALAARRHGYLFRATTKGHPGLLAGTSRIVRLRK